MLQVSLNQSGLESLARVGNWFAGDLAYRPIELIEADLLVTVQVEPVEAEVLLGWCQGVIYLR